MSAPVKFLAVAVAGWVTFRAAAAALMVPEAVAAAPNPAPPLPPPTAAVPAPREAAVTYVPLQGDAGQAPPGAPALPAGYGPAPQPYPMAYGYGPPPGYAYPSAYAYPPGYAPTAARLRPATMPYPIYVPIPIAAAAAMPLPRQTPWTTAPSSGAGPIPLAGDGAPVSRPEADAVPDPRTGSPPAVTLLTPPGPPRLDRWSLSSWSLMRQDTGVVVGAGGVSGVPLATGGQLGASQAGARLTYRFTPRLAANLRLSGAVPTSRSRLDGLNGEAALGISYQPFAGVPVRLMAERRQRIGRADSLLVGGRNAFAFLAEGGIYGQSLPLGFTLDGYGQSGLVSLRQRDWFVDGGLVAERPLFGRYSLGLGMWGGAQKGLNRFDIGQRLSARVTRNIRVSLDYRYKALGNARPGSGFAVVVGSDF